MKYLLVVFLFSLSNINAMQTLVRAGRQALRAAAYKAQVASRTSYPVRDYSEYTFRRKQNVYNNKLINMLRKIKLPILGYYNWELLMRKENGW